MKKGMFFSITAILLVMIALSIVSIKSSIRTKEKDSTIQRMQIQLMDSFVRDFDTIYMRQILSTSSRNVLVNRTQQVGRVDKDELKALMLYGADYVNEDKNFESLYTQSLRTVNFEFDPEVDFNIESVEQITYDKISIDFTVTYTFLAQDSSWHKDSSINVVLPVYGMYHPDEERIIEDNWIQNSTGCYVSEIFADAVSCSGMNIMPP